MRRSYDYGCEKAGRPMADSPNLPNSIERRRRVYDGSVVRLETMIAAQSNRLQKLRHQWVGSPSATLRLEASVEDSIATSKLTLQHIRQCAMTFEACWAILDTVAAPRDRRSDHGY